MRHEVLFDGDMQKSQRIVSRTDRADVDGKLAEDVTVAGFRHSPRHPPLLENGIGRFQNLFEPLTRNAAEIDRSLVRRRHGDKTDIRILVEKALEEGLDPPKLRKRDADPSGAFHLGLHRLPDRQRLAVKFVRQRLFGPPVESSSRQDRLQECDYDGGCAGFQPNRSREPAHAHHPIRSSRSISRASVSIVASIPVAASWKRASDSGAPSRSAA